MNRRPLTFVPGDPESEKPLTPNSVLIGDNDDDLCFTVGVFNEKDISSKWFYRRVEALVTKFTHRFVRNYLLTISHREKNHQKVDVKIGDIVLLFDNTHKNHRMWNKARVIAVHPGRDGVVRAVDLQVGTKNYLKEPCKILKYRSVGNLVLLNINSPSETSNPENCVQPASNPGSSVEHARGDVEDST